MKELKSFKQEPYEAPAILDIAPVTMVHGDGTSGGGGGDDYPEPGDLG